MSITDTSKIDMVFVDDDDAVLVISDHLVWDGHSDDEHMLNLQEKINTYLRYCESGEFIQNFPNAKNKKVKIEINFKYTPNESFEWFYSQVKPVVESAGFLIESKVFERSE